MRSQLAFRGALVRAQTGHPLTYTETWLGANTRARMLSLKGCMDTVLHMFDMQTQSLRYPCVACPRLHATYPKSSASAGGVSSHPSATLSILLCTACHASTSSGNARWWFWMELHRVCRRVEIHLLTCLAVLYRKRRQAMVCKARRPLQRSRGGSHRSRGGSHRLRPRRSYTVPDHWSPFGCVNDALLPVLQLTACSLYTAG